MTAVAAPTSLALDGARVLSSEQFAALCARSEILVSKGGQPAVLAQETAAGIPLVIKIWRRDRLAASLRAYHRRFRLALGALRERGIVAPRYVGHGRVRGSGERVVVYQRLEGEPLRGRLEAVRVARLAGLVARLHDRGIYFRGLHLANVIETPDGALGLIDVQDIRFLPRPLPWRLRVRSLGILCAHPRDLRELSGGLWQALVAAYAEASGLDDDRARRLRERVGQQIRRRTARRAARRARRGLAPFQP